MEDKMSIVLIEVKKGVVQRVTSDDPWITCGVVDYDVHSPSDPYVADFNHAAAELSEVPVESALEVDNLNYEKAAERIQDFKRALFMLEANQERDAAHV
jgi:hypothetical protein